MFRATAIAPEPIASLRAVDVRGSEGRSSFERGSLARPTRARCQKMAEGAFR